MMSLATTAKYLFNFLSYWMMNHPNESDSKRNSARSLLASPTFHQNRRARNVPDEYFSCMLFPYPLCPRGVPDSPVPRGATVGTREWWLTGSESVCKAARKLTNKIIILLVCYNLSLTILRTRNSVRQNQLQTLCFPVCLETDLCPFDSCRALDIPYTTKWNHPWPNIS